MRLRRVIWNPCKEYTRTVRLDTPSESIRTTYPGRNCTRLPPFTPGCAPPFAPGCVPPFAPGCRHLDPNVRRHCIRIPRTSTRMFTSGIQESDGRGGVSTSPDERIRIL
uniref:Uncharacterized protein n=1 Tax=Vitis vinifera TaxID=29760 RepID=A5AM61_VITVI|nr:hypothetical protein VITISV_010518 [Vitis vinifera]